MRARALVGLLLRALQGLRRGVTEQAMHRMHADVPTEYTFCCCARRPGMAMQTSAMIACQNQSCWQATPQLWQAASPCHQRFEGSARAVWVRPKWWAALAWRVMVGCSRRWAAVPEEDWPMAEAQRSIIQLDFDPSTPYGDRRQVRIPYPGMLDCYAQGSNADRLHHAAEQASPQERLYHGGILRLWRDNGVRAVEGLRSWG